MLRADGLITVVIVPSGVTFRIRALLPSVIYKFPLTSRATPVGKLICALMAGPPSPEKPGEPLPARVVRVPSALTKRIRLLAVSAIYRLLEASTATLRGMERAAFVADPPSPPVPPPATVVISPSLL